MSFTAYVSDKEKNERYASYCRKLNKKKSDAVTVANTVKRYRNVDKTNPMFAALQRLNSEHPERLDELPAWVRRNLGDNEAIDVDAEDDDNVEENVGSAVGMLVRGHMTQHHNGNPVDHRRTPLSSFNERTGEPFRMGQVSSVIQPSPDQKVST